MRQPLQHSKQPNTRQVTQKTDSSLYKHLGPTFPVKINKLAICLTPPNKKMKKYQWEQGKSVSKGLKICTYKFLGMPIAMHYVRLLCDNYLATLLLVS